MSRSELEAIDSIPEYCALWECAQAIDCAMAGAGKAKREVETKLSWDEEGALLALATHRNHMSQST
jgi:hypothetical protein